MRSTLFKSSSLLLLSFLLFLILPVVPAVIEDAQYYAQCKDTCRHWLSTGEVKRGGSSSSSSDTRRSTGSLQACVLLFTSRTKTDTLVRQKDGMLPASPAVKHFRVTENAQYFKQCKDTCNYWVRTGESVRIVRTDSLKKTTRITPRPIVVPSEMEAFAFQFQNAVRLTVALDEAEWNDDDELAIYEMARNARRRVETLAGLVNRRGEVERAMLGRDQGSAEWLGLRALLSLMAGIRNSLPAASHIFRFIENQAIRVPSAMVRGLSRMLRRDVGSVTSVVRDFATTCH